MRVLGEVAQNEKAVEAVKHEYLARGWRVSSNSLPPKRSVAPPPLTPTALSPPTYYPPTGYSRSPTITAPAVPPHALRWILG